MMKKSVKFGDEVIAKTIKTRLTKFELQSKLEELLQEHINYEQTEWTTVRLYELKSCLDKGYQDMGLTREEMEIMYEYA
jgi:hypothetical protein